VEEMVRDALALISTMVRSSRSWTTVGRYEDTTPSKLQCEVYEVVRFTKASLAKGGTSLDWQGLQRIAISAQRYVSRGELDT
jgi:hypothetical protein